MSRKTRMTSKATTPKKTPVETVTKASPLVMARALELAKGDRRRLTIKGDGAVIVHNNPVRGK